MRKENLEFNSRSDFERSYLYDLPNGGVFVPTTSDYAISELVLLIINFPEIPDGILLHGRVAWRRPKTKWRSALQPGIGVALDEADPEKVDFLLKFCNGRLEDRRGKSRRIPVKFRVDFLSADNIWHEGLARNISKEGLFVSTNTALTTGNPLVLRLHLTENEPPDKCFGRVARQCYDSSIPGVGIELEYKTPVRRRRIYDYIKQQEARLIEKD
jgi:Tfp pilus assembly protein PilZ